jgi:nucleoside-diphosphate-sugar epimerase
MCNRLRILVTGVGGLLGSELSGTLAERGHACKRRSKNPSLKRPVSPVAPE